MRNRNRRRGFAKTHQTCPCPQHERACFSTFHDDPNSGYCHACARVVRSGHRAQPTSPLARAYEPSIEHVFVPEDVVDQTTQPIARVVNAFSNFDDYHEALTTYTEHRADGIDHTDALRLSGYDSVMRNRLTEISGMVSQLPGFFREMIRRTRVPHILTAFNVGYNAYHQVVFWITNSSGRICNGHAVHYNGLNRNPFLQTRYLYRSAEGFHVSAFFGAEQLMTGAMSWTKRDFDPLAPIVIVEAPKTAMLASVLYPDWIWLAACGTSGVTPAKSAALRGRDVRILFDNDLAGRDGAIRARRVLLEAGAFPSILNPEEVFGGPRPTGWDIGDEVLQILGGRP